MHRREFFISILCAGTVAKLIDNMGDDEGEPASIGENVRGLQQDFPLDYGNHRMAGLEPRADAGTADRNYIRGLVLADDRALGRKYGYVKQHAVLLQ